MNSLAAICLIGSWCAAGVLPALAAESNKMSAQAVRSAVATQPKGHADLSGRNMAGDDLTGLNLAGAKLTGADLSGANLHGVNLLGADLTGANLTDADLTETTIIKAKFDRARMHGAILQTIATSYGMDNEAATAASFVDADLSGTSATVHFSYDNMKGVNFRGTKMSVVMANQSMGLLRSEFKEADLDGADFTGAQLGRITFEFAKLNGAIFRNADLTHADFTGAYLSGADFTGARLDGTVFDGATLTQVKGLPQSEARTH